MIKKHKNWVLLALLLTLFFACGEGEISYHSSNDDVDVMSISNLLQDLDIEEAMTNCEANPECAAKMLGAVSPPPPIEKSSSSVEEPLSSSNGLPFYSSATVLPPLPASSSSSAPIIVVPPTSSSSVVGPPPITPSSSSTTTPPVDGPLVEGTCAPSPATINKGEKATWTFAKAASVPAQSVLAASFDWTFEGATETSHSASGAGGLNKAVTYAESGQFNTTLSVNGNAPIVCAPLQVNGSAITGCKCAVSTTSPDVFKGEEATWTVTGCASVGAEITGYSWNGEASAATTTFSHTFTEKGEEFAPILKVSNDDNTVETVICPTAKAIDSSEPEYELTAQNTKIDLPAGKSTIIMNLPADWHNTTAGTCTFSCNGDGALSGTVDGVAITGSYYGTASIPITSTINSYALAVDLGQAMSCQVGW